MKFQNKYLNIISTGVVLMLIYKLLSNFGAVTHVFFSVFSPVIAGAVIAFFLYRPIKKISKLLKKTKNKFLASKSKLIGVIIVYLSIIAIFSLLAKFVAPILYKNFTEFIENVPAYYRTVTNFINSNNYLSGIATLDNIASKLAEALSFKNLNKYVSVISNIANSFLSFFLSIIISIYIIFEFEGIYSFFSDLYKRISNNGERFSVFGLYIKRAAVLFYKYFIGLSLDAVIIGTITAIVLNIFKVPYALLLGVTVAAGNMIPFFGPIVSSVVVYIISAITFGPVQALWVLVFQIVLGQLDSNFMQPKILSNSTGISPLLVLVSVIVFGEFFGPVGMILGVPVCAALKMIITDYMDNGKMDGSSI